MNKTNLLLLITFLSFPLAAAAVTAGDPDSDSATMITEPESTIKVYDADDDPDAHADDANNIKASAKVQDNAPIPGEHMVPQLTPGPADEKWTDMKFARLQGLNKVTAKTSELKVDLNKPTKFGNLEFIVEKCQRGPENEKTDSAVLLKVWDEIPGQDKKEIFRGWMFASSPAISAIEHPIYDIILLGCGEIAKPVAPTVDKKNDKKTSKKPKMAITAQ